MSIGNSEELIYEPIEGDLDFCSGLGLDSDLDSGSLSVESSESPDDCETLIVSTHKEIIELLQILGCDENTWGDAFQINEEGEMDLQENHTVKQKAIWIGWGVGMAIACINPYQILNIRHHLTEIQLYEIDSGDREQATKNAKEYLRGLVSKYEVNPKIPYELRFFAEDDIKGLTFEDFTTNVKGLLLSIYT